MQMLVMQIISMNDYPGRSGSWLKKLKSEIVVLELQLQAGAQSRGRRAEIRQLLVNWKWSNLKESRTAEKGGKDANKEKLGDKKLG